MNNYKPQKHKHFLVWIHNVTSVKDQQIAPEEIIHICLTLIRSADFSREAQFEAFVKPAARPRISPHCVKTTGILNSSPTHLFHFLYSVFLFFLEITQAQIEKASGFSAVFKDICDWINARDLNDVIVVFPDRWNAATLNKHIVDYGCSKPQILCNYYVILEDKFGQVKDIKKHRSNRTRLNLTDILSQLQMTCGGLPLKSSDIMDNAIKLTAYLCRLVTIDEDDTGTTQVQVV